MLNTLQKIEDISRWSNYVEIEFLPEWTTRMNDPVASRFLTYPLLD